MKMKKYSLRLSHQRYTKEWEFRISTGQVVNPEGKTKRNFSEDEMARVGGGGGAVCPACPMDCKGIGECIA